MEGLEGLRFVCKLGSSRELNANKALNRTGLTATSIFNQGNGHPLIGGAVVNSNFKQMLRENFEIKVQVKD